MFKKIICLSFILLGLAACKGAGKDDPDAGWLPGILGGHASNTVFFALDSSSLSSESEATLKAQAEWWASVSPKPKLHVEGHCDERGTREYNIALGERRAHAAKKFLIAHGVAHDKISTISYGKERPAVIGDTEEAWSKNRRAVTVRAEEAK